MAAQAHPSVAVDGIVLHGGKLVAVRRKNEPYRGMPALPGGFVELGETTVDAVVREVREETGLEAEVEASLGDIRYFYIWEGVRVRKAVHFFLMRATGGDVSQHDHEMEDVRWFPLAVTLRRATYKGEREVLQRAAERLA